MSKLYTSFNVAEVQFLRWIYKVFPTRPLYNEIVLQVAEMKTDMGSTRIFDEFNGELGESFAKSKEGGGEHVSIVDQIFKKDKECLTRISLLRRTKIDDLYVRMVDDERTMFWNNLQALCKYRGMLNACGTQAGAMQDVAMEFLKRNPNLKPEEMHKSVFDELMNGDGKGKNTMRDNILKMFANPDVIKGILQNFGDIVRSDNGDAPDMSALIAELDDEDLSGADGGFEEMLNDMQESGFNPFDSASGGGGGDNEDGNGVSPTSLPFMPTNTVPGGLSMGDMLKSAVNAAKATSNAAKPKPKPETSTSAPAPNGDGAETEDVPPGSDTADGDVDANTASAAERPHPQVEILEDE